MKGLQSSNLIKECVNRYLGDKKKAGTGFAKFYVARYADVAVLCLQEMIDSPEVLTPDKAYSYLTSCFHLPEKSAGEEGETEWLGEQQTLFLPEPV